MKVGIDKTQLRRTLAVLIVAFCVIIVALGWEVLALRAALLSVDHTDQVIGADRDLMRLTVDMETGLRGFLLTRDESFLKPYREALALIGPRFAALNQLVADNPAQRQRLAAMQDDYARWIRRSNPGEPQTPRPARFFDDNSASDVQLPLKAVMDRIRAEHLAFASTEEGLRRERLETERDGETLINVMLLLVGFLAAGSAILAVKHANLLAVTRPSESGLAQNTSQDSPGGFAKVETDSPGNGRAWLRSTASAIGLPLAAVLLSIPLRSFSPYPFVMFYAAVSLVAWMEGMWWGFLSLALSLFLADYFLIQPYRTLAMGFKDALGLVLCASIQLLICWLIDAQQRVAKTMRDQAGLLDLSHDCIMVLDLPGIIQFWNHGAEEMYGFTAEQACGRISHEVLQTEFPRPLAEIETYLLKNGRWEGELRQITREGVRIVVDSRWVLQPAAIGTMARVMEINNDITERKRAEADLLSKTQALMRSNQELDEFAYAASHDLKAPLRVIFNASKWLEEDLEPYLTPATREDMDLLRRRVVRMEKLLDDLLEYSRIGRTADERRTEILSADKLIDNILGLIDLPAGFAVNLSPSLAGILVKRMPLQQILVNLIVNAVKHHNKKTGCIQISVEDLETHLEFAVRDDGPGIPAQFHEQIFKMFQTLKPRDQVEGSGMGLAMVRKHVEFSGGRIVVESEEDHGSTFRFTWPRLQQREEAPL